MKDHCISAEQEFRDGPSIYTRWSAARELMASKKFVRYAESYDFDEGWNILLKGAATSDGLDRLLHVDLIVRISSFVKRLKLDAESALRIALELKLPSLYGVASSRDLPHEARPAEIRENIAIALQYANDTWVYDYIIESLATEDRSQKCRTKLVECLVLRTPNVDLWMDDLTKHTILRRLQQESNANAAAKRLGDIATALSHVVRQNRTILNVSDSTGLRIARLANMMIHITKDDKLPKNICSASIKTIELMDEISNIDLSQIIEPKTYSFLDVVRAWWHLVPYPDTLIEALKPIVSKLETAVIIRARFGQKSETLVGHLSSAVGGRNKANKILHSIAETHAGLAPEIDDWLRGRNRVTSSTDYAVKAMMQTVEDKKIFSQLAPIILIASEAQMRDSSDSKERYDALDSIVRNILSFSNENDIDTFCEVGTMVEYNSELHSTTNNRIPYEANVRVLRSGLRRRRVDGGFDVILKATVE